MYVCSGHIDQEVSFKGRCPKCAKEQQNNRERKLERRKRARERALYVEEREQDDE